MILHLREYADSTSRGDLVHGDLDYDAGHGTKPAVWYSSRGREDQVSTIRFHDPRTVAAETPLSVIENRSVQHNDTA